MPTRASREAAVVAGMPWSCAAGTKWDWTSPAVVAPQMKNPPTSSQNVPVREASARAPSASRAAPVRCGGTTSASVPP